MKKALLVLMILMMVMLVGCGTTHRSSKPPAAVELPSGFELVNPAGNGWFLYSSPVGYFLVSIQIQGKLEVGFSNRFIDMVWIGKELPNGR